MAAQPCQVPDHCQWTQQQQIVAATHLPSTLTVTLEQLLGQKTSDVVSREDKLALP